MIRIQIDNINQVAKDFVTRIDNSVIKNKLSPSDSKRLKGKSLKNGSELQRKIYELYICKPENLKNEFNQFENYLNSKGYSRKRKNNLISRYFDYDSLIGYTFKKQKHSYWLMEKLDIKVCPYCNRSYTFTINTKSKNIRPEFDHFYPKDSNKYPYLALSFYNLIPSCPICNHTKKTTEVDIHPYVESFGDNCKFRIDEIDNCLLDDNYQNWNVFLEKSTVKYDKNISTFALKEFYNQHKDFISEIVFKARAYNDDAFNSIIDTFSEQGLTPKEMKLLIFGTYLDEKELGLRPLSKLSKDIIEQIEMEE